MATVEEDTTKTPSLLDGKSPEQVLVRQAPTMTTAKATKKAPLSSSLAKWTSPSYVWATVKEGALHTFHGFRLFFKEVRIASKYTYRLMRGKKLMRRERKQVNNNLRHWMGCAWLTYVPSHASIVDQDDGRYLADDSFFDLYHYSCARIVVALGAPALSRTVAEYL